MSEKHVPLVVANAGRGLKTRTVTAPFDGARLAEVETAGPKEVESALSAGFDAHRQRRSGLPLHERVEVLERAAAIMSERAAALALEAAAEGGKPLKDSQVEVARAIDSVKLCIEHVRTHQGEVIPTGGTAAGGHRLAFTHREPIGLVVAVSAFNHPLNLIVHQVATAVAAGCPVIVKPADDTPLSCFAFVNILREAGLPDPWCQALLTETIDLAEQLVTDSRVAFFTFIGSAKVGWMLRSKLAPGTRCALEHGGAAPVIMDTDADFERAVPPLAKGGYYHAGQVCVSVQRVFVPRPRCAEFAEALAESAKGFVIGDPTSEATDVGPLIRHGEVTRVAGWVDEAIGAGARRVLGGDAETASTYPCTVLLEPPAEAKVSQLEIFGPVVCVYGYDDLDAACATANSLPYAFQAAVFTADIDFAMAAYKRLDASAIMVNDHTAFRIDGMPFAGLRQSGLGVGGIPYTIHDMTIGKMMVIHSPEL